MTIRRARRDEDKQQRRESMIAAAAALMRQAAYDSITMAQIAEYAGVAKGTVYFYFKTKEELFLTIADRLLSAWSADVDQRLAQLQAGSTAEAVARILYDSLAERNELTSLLGILHTTLLQNVDEQILIRFKQELKERLSRTGAHMERCLPFLQPGQGARVLLWFDTLIIGLSQLSSSLTAEKAVLTSEHELIHFFELNFAQELHDIIKACLSGLERITQQQARP